VGSGQDGLFTLFHEGGHAAHFSNVTMNGACFSQEFPPTSMAYAETQSMFLDSLVEDADWLRLYAKDLKGNSISEELIKKGQQTRQPWRAFGERAILNVGVFERRLYELADTDLTPSNVLKLARHCEKEILGVECGPRPLLAIPHLLSDSSCCSYYGYLLAHMAVYQTRSYFLDKYGYIANNPAIGPELTEKYWNPGNSLSHQQTISNLTGKKLSGQELAALCNLDNESLWAKSKVQMTEAIDREGRSSTKKSADLNAKIFVIHGDQKVASSEQSMEGLFTGFENWIKTHYRS
jgi:Zn-dependent oligopeptidase